MYQWSAPLSTATYHVSLVFAVEGGGGIWGEEKRRGERGGKGGGEQEKEKERGERGGGDGERGKGHGAWGGRVEEGESTGIFRREGEGDRRKGMGRGRKYGDFWKEGGGR